MLCFVCITENRSEPSKYVTFVEGTAVCREHAIEIHQTPPPPSSSADAVVVVQRLKELAERVKQQRAATSNGAVSNGGGALIVDAVPVYPDENR